MLKSLSKHLQTNFPFLSTPIVNKFYNQLMKISVLYKQVLGADLSTALVYEIGHFLRVLINRM